MKKSFWIETIFLQSLFPAKSNIFQKQFRCQQIAFLPAFKERARNGRRKPDLQLCSSASLSVRWGGSSGAEIRVPSERAADRCWGCCFGQRGFDGCAEGRSPPASHLWRCRIWGAAPGVPGRVRWDVPRCISSVPWVRSCRAKAQCLRS